MSRGKGIRSQRARHTVELAIADITLAEKLLGQNQTVLKRLVEELSTVRARLTGAAQLLRSKHDT